MGLFLFLDRLKILLKTLDYRQKNIQTKFWNRLNNNNTTSIIVIHKNKFFVKVFNLYTLGNYWFDKLYINIIFFIDE